MNEEFLRIFEEHRKLVWRIALHRTRNRVEAEEVFQEVWLRFWIKLQKGDVDRARVKGLLVKMTCEIAISAGRKSSARWRLWSALKNTFGLSGELGIEVLVSPPRIVEELETVERVRAVLCEMPRGDDAIIWMKYAEDMSAKVIGEEFGISEAAARQRVSRAAKRFREIWRDRFGDDDCFFMGDK